MTTLRAIGAGVQLLTKAETTYGVVPAGGGPGWRPIYASRFSGGGVKNLGYDPELGQGPDAQDPYYDAQNVDLDMEVHVRIREIGSWLKKLLGPPVTTGTGPYTHVFSSGGDIPSFTVEEGYPNLSTARFYQRLGMKLNQMTIPFARQGPAKAALTGIGQQLVKTNTSASSAIASAYAAGAFMFNQFFIKKDGSAPTFPIVGGNFVFSNNITRVETIGRGDGLIEGADEGDRTCNGSLEVQLTSDTTLFDAAMTNEASFGLIFRFKTPLDATWKLDLEVDRTFISWASPAVANTGSVRGPFAWRAAKNGSNPMLVATLVNDNTSYAGDSA